MRTQAELVNSWLPNANRANIVIAADPAHGDHILYSALPAALPQMEVVIAEDLAVAAKLTGRGMIAVLVLTEFDSGILDLIVDALGRPVVPRIVIVSSTAPAYRSLGPGGITCVRPVQSELLSAIQASARDFESGAKPLLRTGSLLEALAYVRDKGWIRVCNEGGDFGDVCVNNGKAVYAEAGRASGDKALHTITQWTGCLYECRTFPDFLQPNLSRSLSELSGFTPDPPATPPPPAAKPAPPIPSLEDLSSDLEPPVPEALNQMWMEPPAPVAPPPATAQPVAEAAIPEMTDEPAEPDFAFAGPEIDILIDEPAEMMLDTPEDFVTTDQELADPTLPAFAEFAASSTPTPEASLEAPPEPALEPTPEPSELTFDFPSAALFASVATIGDSGAIESCDPPADASYFGADALRVFHDRVAAYVSRHQLGPAPVLLIGGGEQSIAVTAIPGSRRLLAVRISGGRYSEVEEAEMRRLAASFTAQEASV